MRDMYTLIRIAITTVGGYLSAKLGALYPIMLMLTATMAIDYVTGMLASKREALEYPGNPSYGWSSKKGAIGVMKKVGYISTIAVALVADYITLTLGARMGINVSTKGIFALLVAVWYLLNELLSITENVGRMGAPVPSWLSKYIAVLKDKINDAGEDIKND